ncbi:MAG: cyclic pyranopterin monophosphate synthase MoaC [Cyclobacteriaceae bacterium]|nr:cyclic pyranopterin monophosphate synthase MoaC [Cyclobacteriaceae bacterium]
MPNELSHIDKKGNPTMVDVSDKKVTKRIAKARAEVIVNNTILAALKDGDIHTKKGPVFHTAIIAGVMGAKKTAELIPFCHPLALEDCKVEISINGNNIIIDTTAIITGKTGVEMEAITAASVTALTIYDMCKALSHDMVITETKLMSKTGGKSEFKRQ